MMKNTQSSFIFFRKTFVHMHVHHFPDAHIHTHTHTLSLSLSLSLLGDLCEGKGDDDAQLLQSYAFFVHMPPVQNTFHDGVKRRVLSLAGVCMHGLSLLQQPIYIIKFVSQVHHHRKLLFGTEISIFFEISTACVITGWPEASRVGHRSCSYARNKAMHESVEVSFFYLVCTTKGGEARVGGPLTTHSLDLEGSSCEEEQGAGGVC